MHAYESASLIFSVVPAQCFRPAAVVQLIMHLSSFPFKDLRVEWAILTVSLTYFTES